jgi:hypothetical protein
MHVYIWVLIYLFISLISCQYTHMYTDRQGSIYSCIHIYIYIYIYIHILVPSRVRVVAVIANTPDAEQ